MVLLIYRKNAVPAISEGNDYIKMFIKRYLK